MPRSDAPTMANISEYWYETMTRWRMELFLIPATALTTLTLAADLLLLVCIFWSRALRKETRYLLLANTLAADMAFLGFNLVVVVCNALGVRLVRLPCELLTAASITAYCCGVLSITLMVADTYMAVRWPLHYQRLLPPARTRKILAGLWLLVTMYPVSLVVVMQVMEEVTPRRPALCLVLLLLGSMGSEIMVGVHMYFATGAILCTSLILCCYVRLYVVTRTSGIWRSRYSRARVTLLAHGVMLLLHFGPGLVFTIQLVLLQQGSARQEPQVWINVLNMNVLMLLPRACAPYLYGLRYREIYHTLQLLFPRRGLSQVTGP